MRSQYDLILSLGGSCTAAYQLKFRNLRIASFPFDWLTFYTNETFEALGRCFENGFSDWLKPENLVELAGNLHSDNSKYQYDDRFTGYRFIHDFEKSKEDAAYFKTTVEKYGRRIRRMTDAFEKAGNVLLLVDIGVEPDERLIAEFLKRLAGVYPQAHFDLVVLQYDAPTFGRIQKEDILYIRVPRARDIKYDMRYPCAEWDFLDSVSLSGKFRYENPQVERLSFKNKLRYKLWKALDTRLRRKRII